MTDPKPGPRTPLPGSLAAQLTEMALCLEELTAARAKLIRKRRWQGASLRLIATEARISHTAVAKILAR